MDVNGAVAEGFEPVGEAFARNFATLGERGAAVAVYRDGRKVVDLWAGAKDVDGTDPWQRGTAQVVRSATKGVAAAVLLLLHQRGQLDLDAPVGEYWPEFKARGKERVTVRQVLNHRAGLPVLDRPLTPQEALDPARGPEAVAAQAPAWEPGSAHGYHALTYGWMLDEIVRRITGQSAGEWIAAEIAGPLGADFWLGLPAAEESAGRAGRVGDIEGPEPPAGAVLRARPKRSVTAAYTDPDSLTRRAFAAITPFPEQNEPAYRASALPATNGIATADGLARIYAALIGEVDGVRLFDEATAKLARAEESAGPDRVLVVNTRFGLGFMLHGSASPFLSPDSFGHPGRGGSLGFADPASGIAFGYVTNGFRKTVTADPRAQALVRAVRESLTKGA
ncbi:CubicO group peptidase, beta-lactamase class C family [Streptomyces sp. DI166]|uniref:serine hydrolase domain-containing protein n=1 Tax=Streptomyces sp. DI166 TaxID=1839783 RepID=UPI0007F3650E|nr:serine hydrolase domain-containing protein [Streptomyces sp. DI166]SBT92147.1 CubicO group peptidase, beta-lactamase class C family [Streptomyces sp. DI166]